ncbi:MAG TPA: crosslink repair DNA glycosylase YcaQ family protein, partial [Chloroflexota bacterium]|nr:crosslink repair DNA glycosylase YcaQ family protein [Chloroflexota bacterium]
LEHNGISAPKGFRMAYILMHGELHGIICSGVPRGKQQTYALLDERAPLASSRQLSHEEGLAELTRRYFTSHGPATPKDLRWWSSLTLSAIKTGLALAGDALQHREVNGVTYWFGEAEPDTAPSRPAVHLLQAYDEYLVGHSETKYVLDVAGVARWTTQERFVFNLIAVLDSQVIGHWRRTPKRDAVTIEVALYRELDAAQTIALRAAADAHGAFLGLPACLEVSMIEASRAARHAR